MHHFKGSGESHVREPHTGDRNVPTRGRASAAGLSESPEGKASVGHTKDFLLPWLCRVPLWAPP